MADRPKRCQRRVDYKALAEGPAFHRERQTATNWSTSKLYPMNILDFKTEHDTVYDLVHYIGWDKRYDEWRPVNEIVDIPKEFLETTEATSFFYLQLATRIKEALHIQRKTDSSVEVCLPMPRDAFEPLKLYGQLNSSGKYSLSKLTDLNELLGQNWHFKIVNANKDFAFIIEGTLSFCMTERPPLVEFNADGGSVITHRGFVLVVKFVRARGNAGDLQVFLQGLN